MAVPLVDAEDKSECRFCEAPVTKDFRQVFGDNDDIAHRCRQCDVFRRLQKGSAAGQEVDDTDPQTNGQAHQHLGVVTDGGIRE